MDKEKKIKWVVRLPGKADIKVKVGDEVNKDDLLARVKIKKIESFDYSFIFSKLDSNKLAELNDEFKESAINSGDLLCVTGGIFSNKICFPMTGKFLEIDEFGNLKIEKEENTFKEILAPVKAKISKVEEKKIVLEFKAREVKGEALVEGKSWGNNSNKIVDKNDDLKADLDNQILLTKNLDNSFLLKAEVVGVVGVVTNLKVENIRSKLPILYLEKEEWEALLDNLKNVERILINSRVGRLLLVSR